MIGGLLEESNAQNTESSLLKGKVEKFDANKGPKIVNDGPSLKRSMENNKNEGIFFHIFFFLYLF